MMNLAVFAEQQRQAAISSKATGISDGRVVTPGVDTSHGGILYLDSVSVSFDGFKALNDLTLIVDAGELRCVIGPNGAGKTTMMDVITGKTRPDSGTAFFGQTIDLTRSVRTRDRRHRHRPQIPEADGLHRAHGLRESRAARRRPTSACGRRSRAKLDSTARDRILTILETIQLAPEAGRLAGLLSHGQKQWLEIGMLLMQEPQLLLLDEPVAGMTDDETMRSAELFESLAGDYTLVVVEHDMDFVAKIADRVTVLHEGRVLAEGSMVQVQQNEEVIEVFLGALADPCFRSRTSTNTTAAATSCVTCRSTCPPASARRCSAATVWARRPC